MTSFLNATALSPNDPSWPSTIDHLRHTLGAPHNPLLFPPHFLKVTLARIGGHALVYRRGDEIVAAGFLFPFSLHAGRKTYTMRFHAVDPAWAFDPVELSELAAEALPDCNVRFYDSAKPQHYEPSRETHDGVELGRPSAAEAEAIRAIQAAVWGSTPDFLYPADIHGTGFGSSSTLVARAEGRLAGYLFGFAKFEGSPLPEVWQGRIRGDLRVESQQLAVLPDFRSHGVATLLKTAQAAAVRQGGIDLVSWTADPLQWPNAVLNLGRLRAVSFEFLPNLYDFRNALNRVTTSRIGLTWLVGSSRVQASLAAPTHVVQGLASLDVLVLGPGSDVQKIDRQAPTVAVEIPRNWTALQAEDPDQALAWRAGTDRILSAILGCEPGQHVLTGVAEEAGRYFLLAERVTSALLEALV